MVLQDINAFVGEGRGVTVRDFGPGVSRNERDERVIEF